MRAKHVAKALKLAVDAHDEQVDLAGEPYILHPLTVWSMMPKDDYDLQVVALLHDVVEDCDIGLGEIEEQFGHVARFAIDSITKRKGEDYDDYLDRVNKSPLARTVKLADLQHNLRGNISEERRNKYLRAIELLTIA